MNFTGFDFNTTKECITPFQCKQYISEMCSTVTQTKPILFISLAILFDIVEYFLRKYLTTLTDEKQIYHLRLLTAAISSLKTTFLMAALIFISFGVGALH